LPQAQHHFAVLGDIVGGGEQSGVSGNASHVTRGGIVDYATQRFSGGRVDFRWRDVLDQRRGRTEHSVAHAQWPINLFASELVQRLAAYAAHDFAEQYKVDIAVNELGAGRAGGLIGQRLADAGGVA